MLNRNGFFLSMALMFAPFASADYYLKFETSGSNIGLSALLSANSGSWIDVSIIDTHPTDGSVHYENSRIGAWVSYLNAKRATNNNNKTTFYFADVPRSLTITNTSDGSKTTITEGGDAVRFNSAPAFLLPDGLLVAPGIARISSNSYKIYMAAAMPIAKMAFYQSLDPDEFSGARLSGTNGFCVEGWSESPFEPGYVELFQVVKTGTYACESMPMFGGKLSHVIKFK